MTSINKSILSFVDQQKLQFLLGNVMDTCMKHEVVSYAIILLMDDQQEFKLKLSSRDAEIEVMENDLSTLKLSFPDSLLKHTIERGTKLKLTNLSSEKNFRTDPYVIHKNPQAVLCSLIRTNEEVLGTLYVEAELNTSPFSEADLTLFAGLCSQLA
ncbi:MAG: GAF domain-containing protein, partial [Bacteroidota bacterium]